MKSKIILAIASLYTIAILFSCNKMHDIDELDIVVDKEITEFEMTNHLLNDQKVISFANLTEYKEVLSFIYNNQDDEDLLIDYINQNYSISSIREVFKKGMLIVGDSLITADVDELSIYSITKNPIKSSIDEADWKVSSLIAKFPVRLLVDEVIEYKYEYSYKTAYWASNRRIVARLYYVNGLISFDFDARTTAQRRYLGAWIQEKADIVGISHNGGYVKKYNGDPIEYLTSQNWQNTNQADIRRTVWLSYNSMPMPFPWSTCVLTHSGKRGSSWVYVSNNELFDYN